MNFDEPGYEPVTTQSGIWQLIIAIVIVTAIAAVSVTMAWSASMEYCRPFASHMTDKTIKRIWVTFYHTCLNQDEDPTEPDDWASINEIIQQTGIGVTPAEGPAPKIRPDKTPLVSSIEVCGRPIPEDPTLDKRVWCKSHFRSFKASDGTVVCKRNRKRVPCA